MGKSYLIIAALLSIHSSTLSKRITKVILNHSGVPQYFLDIRTETAARQESEPPFADRGEDFIDDLCASLIRANSISWQNGVVSNHIVNNHFRKRHHVAGIPNKDARRVRKIDYHFYDLNLTGRIEVFLCARNRAYSMYVENGHNLHKIFVFALADGSDHPKIGLALTYPRCNWNMRWPATQLNRGLQLDDSKQKLVFAAEKYFRGNLKIKDGIRKKPICDLNEFDRIQLCSIAFAIWNSFRTAQETSSIYMLNSDYPYCVRDVDVKLQFDPQFSFVSSNEHHTVDLMACPVRADADVSSYVYVAVNQQHNRGAFIIEKSAHGGHYFLTLCAGNIEPLKSLN